MKSKGLAIFATVMLAMMLVGVSYALWSDYLYIEGTVETGYIDAEFVERGGEDDEPPEKDVSYIECIAEGDTLFVTVYNAYPGIEYRNYFGIHNRGSIPIHIYEWGYVPPQVGDPVDPRWVSVELFGDPPYQLHPCDTLDGLVKVKMDNSALQDHVYTFALQIHYGQWNEAPPT